MKAPVFNSGKQTSVVQAAIPWAALLPQSARSTREESLPEARKLQEPVYNILPSTTAVFSYAVGSRKLSANEQFFVGAQSSKFVTNNSDYISRHFSVFELTDHVAYVSLTTKLTKIV